MLLGEGLEHQGRDRFAGLRFALDFLTVQRARDGLHVHRGGQDVHDLIEDILSTT